jgi:hypothetical protein
MSYRAPAEIAIGEGKYREALALNTKALHACVPGTAPIASEAVRLQRERISNLIK